MAQIEAALDSGEAIVHRARLHPMGLLGTASAGAAIVLVVALIVLRNDLAPQTVALLCLAGAAAVVVACLPTYLRWRATEVAVTGRRVIARVGLRHVHTVEPAAVEVHRNLWGQWLDYGAVRILDANGTVEEFHPVRAPEALATAVRRLTAPSERGRSRRA